MAKKERDRSVKIGELKRHVARAVLVAPDVNPKTGLVFRSYFHVTWHLCKRGV